MILLVIFVAAVTCLVGWAYFSKLQFDKKVNDRLTRQRAYEERRRNYLSKMEAESLAHVQEVVEEVAKNPKVDKSVTARVAAAMSEPDLLFIATKPPAVSAQGFGYYSDIDPVLYGNRIKGYHVQHGKMVTVVKNPTAAAKASKVSRLAKTGEFTRRPSATSKKASKAK